MVHDLKLYGENFDSMKADKKVREMIVTAFGKTEKYLLSNTYGVS